MTTVDRRIPPDAELMFIETVSTGTVHLAVRYQPHHSIGNEAGEVLTGGAALIAMATKPTVTRCGKRTFPQFEQAHEKTTRFADDRLCGACYRTLEPEDQERAFEHEQPDSTRKDNP